MLRGHYFIIPPYGANRQTHPEPPLSTDRQQAAGAVGQEDGTHALLDVITTSLWRLLSR